MTLHLLQYTLTHRLQATDSLPPSLFKAWFLFMKSVSCPFLISTFLLCWILLFVSNSIFPSWPPSFCSSSHLCLLSIILSPASFLLFLFYLFHCWQPIPFYLPLFLNILPLLKSYPCSFSVLYSLLALQLCSSLALFFFFFSFSSATSHPLFSPCLSLSPFLFLQPLSPSLWVSGLCGGSHPPVGHPAGERAEKQTVGQRREGRRKEIKEERREWRWEKKAGWKIWVPCEGDREMPNSQSWHVGWVHETGPYFSFFQIFPKKLHFSANSDWSQSINYLISIF